MDSGSAKNRLSAFFAKSVERFEIESPPMVAVLAIICMTNPDITLEKLCDCLAEMEPKSKMKPQALCRRINSEHAADFLREVLALAIRKNLEPVKSPETNALPLDPQPTLPP